MKKLYAALFSIAVIAAIILTSFNDASTSPSQPPTARTLAPGEGSCAASGCHSGSGGTGNISVSFSGGSTYKADSIYSVTVTVTDGTASKFGFELTALDASNVKAGDAAVINTMTTSLQNAGNGRQYVGHKTANSTNTWTFNWTAPSSNVGDVTFYYTGNGANGNSAGTGDHIYSGTTTLSFEPTAGISEIDNSIFFVQNPVSGSLNLSYKLERSGNVTVDLFDVTGKLVMHVLESEMPMGDHSVNKSLNLINPGMYIVRFVVDGKVESRKVLVL